MVLYESHYRSREMRFGKGWCVALELKGEQRRLQISSKD